MKKDTPFPDCPCTRLYTLQRQQDPSSHACTHRCWAGKTSYAHLAPEYEYKVKHLMKAYKISLKHVPWPQIRLWVCVD